MQHIGVIGCGDVATSAYFPGLATMLDRVSVVACFDILADRAERAAAQFGATAYTDYNRFLEHAGLDAVLNLTPAPLHYEISAAALRAGRHVYTEKPIASSLEQAQALIDLASEQNRLLLCAPGTMVTDRFRWLNGVLRDGVLGRPTLAVAQTVGMGPAAWRQYSGDPAVFYSPSVGPLIDTGVYLLHGITGLLGPARRVQAMGGVAIPTRSVLIPERYGEQVTVTANDHMLLHLDFGDSTFAQILSSFAVPRSKAPVIEIHCTAGSFSIGLDAWYSSSAPIDVYRTDESIYGLEGWAAARSPSRGPQLNTLVAGTAHFIDCLEGVATPLLTAQHALHVLEIMLLAERSTREGMAFELTTQF